MRMQNVCYLKAKFYEKLYSLIIKMHLIRVNKRFGITILLKRYTFLNFHFVVGVIFCKFGIIFEYFKSLLINIAFVLMFRRFFEFILFSTRRYHL